VGVKARDLLTKGTEPNVIQGPHKELNAAEDDGDLEYAEDGTDEEEDHVGNTVCLGLVRAGTSSFMV